MLSKVVEVFKGEYSKKGDAMILDSYIPADGTYVIVKPSDNGFDIDEKIDIKMDKKTKQIDRMCSKYMKYICLVDYYSKVTDMNKAILSSSGKVIQGNNYLSFIIKKESITNGKLTEAIIDEYYAKLRDPRTKYSTSQALQLYDYAEKKVGQVDIDRLDKIQSWIKNNLFSEFKEYNGKDYLKIYFYYPEDEYKKESERYYIPNIYNSNSYNITINGKIYGLHNNNMGLNAKKPYLENRTRKNSTPYLINQEDVQLQKKFFDYLMNQANVGNINIYINDKVVCISNKEFIKEEFSGIFIRIKKGKEVEIIDFDTINNYNPKLKRMFEYKNILGVDYDKLKVEYGNVRELESLQQIINEVIFSNILSGNYFTEPKDISIKDNILVSNLLTARTALFNWFYKGNMSSVWSVLQKTSVNILKGSILKGYKKASDQFNLIMSLKEYFEGGVGMADIILQIKDDLRNKISEKETGAIESDRAYFFAVGQLVSFFISRSKGKKKPLSLANPFINAKKDGVIKEKLKALYKKYNYDIESYNYKFKNLYAMAMSYEVNGKIKEDLIIAGYLHSNLLYESSKNNNEKESNEIIEEVDDNE